MDRVGEDELLLDVIWSDHQKYQEMLFELTVKHLLTRSLFDRDSLSEIFSERVKCWRLIINSITNEDVPNSYRIMRPGQLWHFPMALSQFILRSKAKVVGFAGAPGAGKSTLTGFISRILGILKSDSRFLNVSLDDFYHPRAVRAGLGLKWRAQPGSHDIPAAVAFLKAVQAGDNMYAIPTFDQVSDDRGKERIIDGKLDTILLDGWFVGMRDKGYENIANCVDLLIYLDCPIDLAKHRRFEREREIRSGMFEGRKGLTQDEMSSFWSEVLEPGVSAWVEPIRNSADLVLQLDANGLPVGVQSRFTLHSSQRLD
jgi:uridine kinase